MNKNIIIGIVVVVVVLAVGGGIYRLMQNQNGAGNAPAPTTPIAPPPTNPSPTPGTSPSSAPTLTLPPAPIPMPAIHAVTIKNFSFSPATITINKGDTVVWTNNDPMAHTVTGNNGGPASQAINSNGTYSFTFNSAGSFAYHCSIHPSMTGMVVVR